MKPYRETEIKLRVKNPRAMQRKLTRLGFERTKPREFENNLLFDFPDRRLYKSRRLLRLRFTDGRSLLTFKGPPRASRRYKVRDETETVTQAGEQTRGILEAMGLRVYFRYQKYRTTYAPPAGSKFSAVATVVLDETPIGDFLELEGPAQWIEGMARRLGFGPGDFITASYASLHRQYGRSRGKVPGDMVFRQRKS